jgi:hypothetical protein
MEGLPVSLSRVLGIAAPMRRHSAKVIDTRDRDFRRNAGSPRRDPLA